MMGKTFRKSKDGKFYKEGQKDRPVGGSKKKGTKRVVKIKGIENEKPPFIY